LNKLHVSLLAVVLAAASAAASVHLTVSTTDPQAQAAIDRGLFLYYAYNGEDAARAFAQAAVLDPRLAMAYWGTALANGPDLNTPLTEDRFERAARAIRQAASLDAGLSARERGFIAIMALRYQGAFANWAADDAAYRRAMLAFAESSQDENAQLLAAEALLEAGGLAWQQGTLANDESQTALTLVSSVLRDDPSSVMANHLCIHLYDLAPDRTPALPCAQRLDAAALPPEAEHLAHMPAHYWIETGDYAAALRSSERAYALLSRLTGDDAESEHTQRYEKHDVAVGYSAAMMLGNYTVAQRWSQRMTAAFGTSFGAITALRFGRYDAAYATDGNEFAGASVRGLAAVHLGRIAEAHAIAAHLPAGNAMQGYMPQLFLARLAEADGKYDEAERWIERGRTNQRAAFAGELIPFFPADEALGGLRLRHGDAAGAAAAFTDALTAYPNDPRALFGLAQASGANGASAHAAAARARFEKEWEGADTNVGDALP
jgi:hypothetical protein